MRAKWSVGLTMVAFAAPFGAHADGQTITTVQDLWGRTERLKVVLPTTPPAAGSQQDSAAAAVRGPDTLRAVDTQTRRDFEGPGAAREAGPVASTPRNAPSARAYTAAPEMNAGLAVTGLTLLFGAVAILRGRRIEA